MNNEKDFKIYAYCRVSTQYQQIDRQVEAINKYTKENNIEIDEWFSDIITGGTFDRENYNKMKAVVKENDVIIIKELDRFGRNMEGIKKEWQYFMDKGIRIIVIDMPLISSDLEGKKTLDMRFISNLVFEVLCFSAEKEKEKIVQRTKEALAVKKAKGVVLGRPKKFEPEQEQFILDNYGKMTGAEIQEALGITFGMYNYFVKCLRAKGKIIGMTKSGRRKKCYEK